jgi:predicted ATPase/DNA-binding NarL/FixJ family response regulator
MTMVSAAASGRQSASRRDNLPTPLTSFVGRDREVAELTRLIVQRPLVTLVGSPGVGKTRLALRVATEVDGRFPDGAWLVELAPLADPMLVPRAVASALGLHEATGRPPLEVLFDALRDSHLLLILDNCEHLVAACAELVIELLRVCPQVRVLATSREALAIDGEVAWRVPSLSVPTAGRALAPERLADAEAVRLFVDRARLATPTFAVTEQNAPTVARVCRRLDGIPLAIEMAAARVRVLSVEQISLRLDDRFRLLTAGSRTTLPRQQTLRALVDWSYDLLADQERTLLRRLAVFAGGWPLEAAEAVCAFGDPTDAPEDAEGADRKATSPSSPLLAPYAVLNTLAGLVDKSLVVAEPCDTGEMRYRLLETLAQYGQERLADCDESEALGRRHAVYFMELAERAEPGLVGAEQTGWLNRLEREHDNLRAALRWAVKHDEVETGLRLGAALWRFWYVHGHLSEGQRWLEALLSHANGASPWARAKALTAAGNLALARGLYEQARAFQREGLALWRELGDRSNIATALYSLGRVAHRTGDYASARTLTEESLALRRSLRDGWGTAVSVNMLGEIARAQGDYATAAPLYEEGVELFRSADAPRGVAIATHNLGIVARAQGDHRRAETLHHQALALFLELGDKEQIVCSLIKLARLALIQGQIERAARLSGVVAAQREAIGTALLPDERADHLETVVLVQTGLDEATFASAWAAGQGMPLTQAAEEALTSPQAAAAVARPAANGRHSDEAAASDSHTSTADRRATQLSAREREVVGLVARGFSNRQIAETLVISERTAEWWVAKLRAKLDLESRAQLAVWAAEHGLKSD